MSGSVSTFSSVWRSLHSSEDLGSFLSLRSHATAVLWGRGGKAPEGDTAFPYAACSLPASLIFPAAFLGPMLVQVRQPKVVFINPLVKLTTELFRTCFSTTTVSNALFLLFLFSRAAFSGFLLKLSKSSETYKQVFHTPVEVRYLPTVKELIHYSMIDYNSLFGALLYKSLKCVFT